MKLTKNNQVKILESEKAIKRWLSFGWANADIEQPENDELEILKAECDLRGIKYHHKAGITKLKELLGE